MERRSVRMAILLIVAFFASVTLTLAQIMTTEMNNVSGSDNRYEGTADGKTMVVTTKSCFHRASGERAYYVERNGQPFAIRFLSNWDDCAALSIEQKKK
jgi:hypothetical protein